MASSRSRASFSSLPPELRNRIYRLIIASDQVITPTLKVTRRQRGDLPGGFLSTSKVFNTEAAPVLYSSNHFSFKSVYDGVVFLKRMGPVNRIHVRKMSYGTFWLDQAQTQALNIRYEGAQEMVMDWVATNLPSLTFMSFDSLPPCGSKWQLNTLGKLRYLINRLPDLDHVLYSKKVRRLVLRNGPIDETLKGQTQDNYAAFDVHDLIKKNVVKPKAVLRPKTKTTVTKPRRNVVTEPVRAQEGTVVKDLAEEEDRISAEETRVAKMAAKVEEIAAMEANMAARLEQVATLEARMAARMEENAAKEAWELANAEKARIANEAVRMKELTEIEAKRSAAAEKARVATKAARANQSASRFYKATTTKNSEVLAENVRKRLAAAFLRK